MNGKNNYEDLFKRNKNIISDLTQNKIKKLKLLIAGCGSVGGAFIEGASRLGVIHYRLAEPDNYDTHNLNRQFVYPCDIGKNKASVHANRLKELFLNCHPVIEIEPLGINSENLDSLLMDIDLVFDGVDVTTTEGIKAKILLHQMACQKKIAVVSSLDLGFKQWIRIYDYRKITSPLDGHLEAALSCQNPLKSLMYGFCPPEELSVEILEEVIKLLTQPGTSACQLGSCCHLLAAFTGPLIIRFCEGKSLPPTITFDLMRALEDQLESKSSEEKRLKLLKNLMGLFQEIA